MAEESQEHRELKGAFFRLGAAHGNINAVADGRKHVKADAQRQRRGEHRQQPRHNSIDAFGRKACILKAAQHGQVQQHQHRQQWFLWASHPSHSPPSQLIQASNTKTAAPFSPAQAKRAD